MSVNHYHHDPKVYEDLGRACEANGLGWVADDGEFRFQPPAEVIAEQARAELQRTFDLQWKADQRAIKQWQVAHPGNDLVWPDRADMVLWLMGRHEATLALVAACSTMVAAEDALLADLRAEGRHPDLTENPWTLVDAMRQALPQALGVVPHEHGDAGSGDHSSGVGKNTSERNGAKPSGRSPSLSFPREELREKVIEALLLSDFFQGGVQDAEDLAIHILALVSPPLGGDLSARELRSDADAATTDTAPDSGVASTRARGGSDGR